ncbi:MAG: ABC transporter ATP-binding protein [Nitrospinae bacterium]|nr:ABC transporter ATP-binding protein [Nitrospinota bacterium]
MIRVSNLSKVYTLDGTQVTALGGVSFHIEKGSYTALMGPSGSGKSTLMNILGLLDTPTTGEYYLNGVNVAGLPDDTLAQVRNREIGFVFQSHNLLPRNTVLENVCLPLYYRGIGDPSKSAKEALERVGLSHRIHHFPGQISGGESQRTAIARAIISQPSVIFADEPTGNLDSKTGDQIMGILRELNESGVTIVMVTHDSTIAGHARRIIRLKDGRMVE